MNYVTVWQIFHNVYFPLLAPECRVTDHESARMKLYLERCDAGNQAQGSSVIEVRSISELTAQRSIKTIEMQGPSWQQFPKIFEI
jgi:hypothetical protein